jgi:hypothetical protein
MAGSQIPGPLGIGGNTPNIDAGTSAKTASPLPGPIGMASSLEKAKCPTADEVVIAYDASADKTVMTATAIKALKEICSRACISSVKVTSTARTATDQARVMYDMIKAKGAKYVKSLYGTSGDKVVDVFEESAKKKLSSIESLNCCK